MYKHLDIILVVIGIYSLRRVALRKSLLLLLLCSLLIDSARLLVVVRRWELASNTLSIHFLILLGKHNENDPRHLPSSALPTTERGTYRIIIRVFEELANDECSFFNSLGHWVSI
jgi:hypothetical protein